MAKGMTNRAAPRQLPSPPINAPISTSTAPGSPEYGTTVQAAPPVPARPWILQPPIRFPAPLPPRPYVPIRLAGHAHYGTQGEPGILCTDFARQAVERLFDDSGKLDRGAIMRLMEDVNINTQLPVHHRENLMRTLAHMGQGGELATTLNSICAHPGVRLRGPAADLVHATLNLPPGQQQLTAVHARKAAAMALLGNLRQGKVGSCFATSAAIVLHEDAPEVVARDLKTLLETNKLVFDRNGTKFDMPLNKRISTGDLDIEVLMRADGTCHGNASNNGNGGPSYRLHETPGMQAALTALGIPQPMMEQAVTTALRQMNLQGDITYRVSKRSILEHIARNHANPALPGNPLASALNAYAGREDVRLLRAWEYTLAGAAEIDRQAVHVDMFSAAALFGPDIPGRPDLGSLARHTGMLTRQLAADARFRSTPLQPLSTHLFNDIQAVMKNRFMLQYDADIKQGTLSSDGVSNRGGFVLYDRLPPNDPSKWVRIDNPKTFQQALAHAVSEAAWRTHAGMQNMPGNPQANQAALQEYVRHLGRHIHSDAFTEFTARNMNPNVAGQPGIDLQQCGNLPWKQARGADFRAVFRQYGGTSCFLSPALPSAGTIDQSESGQAPGMRRPPRAGDATPVLSFVFDSLREMKSELGSPIDQRVKKLPIGNSLHAFSLLTGTFRDALQYESVTSEQWIHHHVTAPAMHHVAAERTEPPLQQFISELSRALGLTPHNAQLFASSIAGHIPMNAGGHQRYTLTHLHRELVRYCESQPPAQRDKLYAAGEAVMWSLAPVPGVVIADTNWSDSRGNPKHMLAVHHPFRNSVDLHVADFDGKNRHKLGGEWTAGQWTLGSPIGRQRPASR